MSRITQRGATGPINLFQQATSVSTGTGFLDPSFSTYVGEKFTLADGREVSLVSVGATAIASGVLVQGSAIVANHQNLAVAVTTVAATAGTFQVSVTLGATKLNQQQYQGGFLVVNAGTGIGQTLQIASHPGAASSGAGVVITLSDAIQVTLDATSKVCLIANPYTNVVINPTTATATPVGVTFYPLAASTAVTSDANGVITNAGVQQYALVVNYGITSCLNDGNTVAGLGLSPSTNTAGSLFTQTSTGAGIARALQAGVTTESRAVFVDL